MLIVNLSRLFYLIFQDTSFPRMFKLFRVIGLRHLVVVDRNNQVCICPDLFLLKKTIKNCIFPVPMLFCKLYTTSNEASPINVLSKRKFHKKKSLRNLIKPNLSLVQPMSYVWRFNQLVIGTYKPISKSLPQTK